MMEWLRNHDLSFLLLIPMRAILTRLGGSAHPYPPELKAYPNPSLTTAEARLFFHAIPDAFTAFIILNDSYCALIVLVLSFLTNSIGHSAYAVDTDKGYFMMGIIEFIRALSVYIPITIFTHSLLYLIPLAASSFVPMLCWWSFLPLCQKKLNFTLGKLRIPLIYTIPSSEPQELLRGANTGLMSYIALCL